MKLTLIRPAAQALTSQDAVITDASLRLETPDRYCAPGVRSYTVTHSLTSTFAGGPANACNRPDEKEIE